MRAMPFATKPSPPPSPRPPLEPTLSTATLRPFPLSSLHLPRLSRLIILSFPRLAQLLYPPPASPFNPGTSAASSFSPIDDGHSSASSNSFGLGGAPVSRSASLGALHPQTCLLLAGGEHSTGRGMGRFEQDTASGKSGETELVDVKQAGSNRTSRPLVLDVVRSSSPLTFGSYSPVGNSSPLPLGHVSTTTTPLLISPKQTGFQSLPLVSTRSSPAASTSGLGLSPTRRTTRSPLSPSKPNTTAAPHMRVISAALTDPHRGAPAGEVSLSRLRQRSFDLRPEQTNSSRSRGGAPTRHGSSVGSASALESFRRGALGERQVGGCALDCGMLGGGYYATAPGSTSASSATSASSEASSTRGWVRDADAASIRSCSSDGLDTARFSDLSAFSSGRWSAGTARTSMSLGEGDLRDRRPSGCFVEMPATPPSMPLPQNPPSVSRVSVTEHDDDYTIAVCLPHFHQDLITVSRRRNNAVHIVADNYVEPNQGHFERLVQLRRGVDEDPVGGSSGEGSSGSGMEPDEDPMGPEAPSSVVTATYDGGTETLTIVVLKRRAAKREKALRNGERDGSAGRAGGSKGAERGDCEGADGTGSRMPSLQKASRNKAAEAREKAKRQAEEWVRLGRT